MTKSNCWKGLAIAGIWVGTAIIAFPAPQSIAIVSIGSVIATIFVALIG